MEITKLIEFYETNPMLYDQSEANYTNRNLKRTGRLLCCNENGNTAQENV